jgi:hypothetical protein
MTRGYVGPGGRRDDAFAAERAGGGRGRGGEQPAGAARDQRQPKTDLQPAAQRARQHPAGQPARRSAQRARQRRERP